MMIDISNLIYQVSNLFSMFMKVNVRQEQNESESVHVPKALNGFETMSVRNVSSKNRRSVTINRHNQPQIEKSSRLKFINQEKTQQKLTTKNVLKGKSELKSVRLRSASRKRKKSRYLTVKNVCKLKKTDNRKELASVNQKHINLNKNDNKLRSVPYVKLVNILNCRSKSDNASAVVVNRIPPEQRLLSKSDFLSYFCLKRSEDKNLSTFSHSTKVQNNGSFSIISRLRKRNDISILSEELKLRRIEKYEWYINRSCPKHKGLNETILKQPVVNITRINVEEVQKKLKLISSRKRLTLEGSIKELRVNITAIERKLADEFLQRIKFKKKR